MQRSRLALVPPWTSRALRPSRAVWLALGLVVGACGGGGPLQPGGSGGSGGSGGGGDFVPGLDERPQVEACVPVADPPSLLSEHPCFGGAPPRPSEELVPYDVRTPLWSDAALKERFLAIPAPARATVSA